MLPTVPKSQASCWAMLLEGVAHQGDYAGRRRQRRTPQSFRFPTSREKSGILLYMNNLGLL
ncbi:hypothetical protein [Brasilonema sp. UFV-L1]|uniref:hypothetical protein n=1 Tax=Brasilonema sp. UFV-L1 TaxID=2234130 RepID=UPI00145E4D2A|nr:hypothetical protein [Brasilonema sp. UFV-L1]